MAFASPIAKQDFKRLQYSGPSLLMLALLLPTVSEGQSFDCTKASTASEITICNDEDLSWMDVELLTVYRAAIQNGDPEAVKKIGRAFWAERRDCNGDAICLEKSYTEAIAFFSTGAAPQPTQAAEAAPSTGDAVAPVDVAANSGNDEIPPTAEMADRADALPASDASTCSRDMRVFMAYLDHLDTKPLTDGATGGPASMIPEERLLNTSSLTAGRDISIIGIPPNAMMNGSVEDFCASLTAAEERFSDTSFRVDNYDGAGVASSLRFEPQNYSDDAEAASPVEASPRLRIEMHATDDRERERIDYRNIYADVMVSPWKNFPDPLPPLWVSFALIDDTDPSIAGRCTVTFGRTMFSTAGTGVYAPVIPGNPQQAGAVMKVADLIGGWTITSLNADGEAQYFARKERWSDLDAMADRHYDSFEQAFDMQGFTEELAGKGNLNPAVVYETPDRATSDVVNSLACQAALKAERSELVEAGEHAIKNREGMLGFAP